jgi:hypothetical protein
MVAVACSQCGQIHHSGHEARPGDAGSRSTNEPQTVFDVPAVTAETPPTGAPAPGLSVPARLSDLAYRSAPTRMRMSATYTNGGVRSPAAPTPPTAPKALPRGRPMAARPAPRQARPEPPPAAHREPKAPRRPLVQLIQEVLNRGVTRDLEPGTCVVVRNRFNGRWTPGFAVQEVLEAGYRIRRDHTGAVLPTIFLRSDVAAAKSGAGGGAKLHGRAAACASI